MNWFFKKEMSYFEVTCVIIIGALLQYSFWFILLAIPSVFIQTIGHSLTKRAWY